MSKIWHSRPVTVPQFWVNEQRDVPDWLSCDCFVIFVIFVFKPRNCVLKPRNFAFKMMNFAVRGSQKVQSVIIPSTPAATERALISRSRRVYKVRITAAFEPLFARFWTHFGCNWGRARYWQPDAQRGGWCCAAGHGGAALGQIDGVA